MYWGIHGTCMKKNLLNGILAIGILFNVSCKKLDVLEQMRNDDLPHYFSWRDHGIVTPARNQGSYGACGVFAAMAVIEALIKRDSGLDVDLSEQHYINASQTWVETGVNPGTVFEFVRTNGIVTESRLPYQATQTNEIPEGQSDYYISRWGSRPLESLSVDESRQAIKRAVQDYGPIAAAMDIYSDLKNYQGGIYQPDNRAVNRGGHWVVIVGWQNDSSLINGGYWIVKNSFGPAWGEHGFFNIPYNTCNLDRYIFFYAQK